MKIENHRNWYLLFLLGMVALHLLCFVEIDWNLCDGASRWKESRYLFLGIDPFKVIFHQMDPLPEVGSMFPTAGALPWALVLGNVITPCFLPMHAALMYTVILQICLVPITTWLLSGYLVEHQYFEKRVDAIYA